MSLSQAPVFICAVSIVCYVHTTDLTRHRAVHLFHSVHPHQPDTIRQRPAAFQTHHYYRSVPIVCGISFGRPLTLVVTAFVVIDVVTTLLQIAGAALIGVASSAQVNGDHSSLTPEEANDILLSGLAAQVRRDF